MSDRYLDALILRDAAAEAGCDVYLDGDLEMRVAGDSGPWLDRLREYRPEMAGLLVAELTAALWALDTDFQTTDTVRFGFSARSLAAYAARRDR